MTMARRPRLRAVLANTALVVASVLVALGIIEITLRWRPTLLGQEYANGVLSRYTRNEGGILLPRPQAAHELHDPQPQDDPRVQRLTWTHETDALGFRNRGLTPPADVVLLGDSFIYGHGVDLEGTVGHFLGERTGWRVANLGRQADCAFQEAYLLHAYIGVFKPRHVVYFYFENDIVDLDSYLRPRRCGSSSTRRSIRSATRSAPTPRSRSSSARRSSGTGGSSGSWSGAPTSGGPGNG